MQRGLFSQQPLSLADKPHITSTKVTAAPNELKCLDVSANIDIVSVEYIPAVHKTDTIEMLYCLQYCKTLIVAVPPMLEKVIEVDLSFVMSFSAPRCLSQTCCYWC